MPKTEKAPPTIAQSETRKLESGSASSMISAWIGETSYETTSDGSVSRVRPWLVG